MTERILSAPLPGGWVVEVRVYVCDLCGHGPWIQRKQTAQGSPRICPKCKRTDWNRPKPPAKE